MPLLFHLPKFVSCSTPTLLTGFAHKLLLGSCVVFPFRFMLRPQPLLLLPAPNIHPQPSDSVSLCLPKVLVRKGGSMQWEGGPMLMTKGVGATLSLVVCPRLKKKFFFPLSPYLCVLEECMSSMYLIPTISSATDNCH